MMNEEQTVDAAVAASQGRLTLSLDTVGLGDTTRLAVDPPLVVYLSGPYGRGQYVAAVPGLSLAVQGISASHVLGQVEGMVALALKTGGEGLNSEGQRLARLLAGHQQP